ncbi:MAG: radical SAM protein, partial [Planctomycetota bacterium]
MEDCETHSQALVIQDQQRKRGARRATGECLEALSGPSTKCDPREGKPHGRTAKIYSQAIIHVTFKCNMSCPRCTQKVHRSKYKDYMITRDQYLKILDLIGNRVKSLTLTGGEPTLWIDLKWAIEKAHEEGIKKVSVITNGLRRNASDYGDADKVYVTNYGAINRIDFLRLRKQLGRRFCITNTCQFEWQLSSQGSTLPAICNCAHLFLAGDEVWPCQGAVYEKPGLPVEDDSIGLFESQN